MRAKIRLDTSSDAINFAHITSQLKGKIVVKDGNGFCVNAKSVWVLCTPLNLMSCG